MKINKKNAIILVSGGMDSCVTAAQAINDSYKPYFLHVNYGQLTKKREQKAFNDIASLYLCFSKIYFSLFGRTPAVEMVIFFVLKLNPIRLENV